MDPIKEEYFRRARSLKNETWESVRFEVCQTIGEIRLYGKNRLEIKEFLVDYYKKFQVTFPEAKCDFIIHYKEVDFDIQGMNSSWYDNLDEFRVWPSDQGWWVEQRDFFAHADIYWREISALGFGLSYDNTDPIDNLVMIAMSRHLSRQEALPIHAATVNSNGDAFVFYGVSGAGKSTLAEQSARLDNLKVLSGDQIYLKIEASGELFAYPCSTTIPEFENSRDMLESTPLPVKALIHLVPYEREWGIRKLRTAQALAPFFKQVFFWKEFGGSDQLTNLVLKMVSSKKDNLYEMTYKKDESFWSRLLEAI